MPLATGQTLSFYKILGPIGAGGMGEVYRARDTRLEREVAIKVLPEDLADDDERLRRLKREAKTLASLNHPNVAGIHGVDQDGEVYFLALELVPGKDLSTLLAKGPLPVDEALDVCRQIAEGLEAAHDSGVVHRDLKPANVRVTPEGVVKILDFGLAKPIRPKVMADDVSSAEPDSIVATEEGFLMGTPTYMSPEQARGKPVDRRTDIWAFGCVLFECLTGARAYGGGSVPDILAAVLERGWDRSRLPAATPAHVRELLERCLEKDPRQRLRDIGEARIALEGTREPPQSTKRASGVSPALALVLALILGIGAYVIGGLRTPDEGLANPLDRYTPRKLIDWPGAEYDASIDREGKRFSFVSDKGGRFNAWAGSIDGIPKNLTQGRKTEWSLKVRDAYMDPDGSNIFLSGGTSHQTSSVEFSGGPILNLPWGKGIENLAWSYDRTRVVYHVPGEGDALFVADADGDNAREIARGLEGIHQHYAIWSCDDEWIYVVRGEPASQQMDLWRISLDGEVEEQLTTDKRDVGYPTPIDDNTVLYIALETNGAGPWLWALDVKTRESRRAAMGIEQYMSIAASEGGTRLVATVANPISRLLSVPILKDEVGEDRVTEVRGLESRYASAPRYGSDGTLFFVSLGGVWCQRDATLEVVVQEAEVAGLVPPAIAPDGQSLAVVSRKRGRPRLKIVGVDRVVIQELSASVDIKGAPTWSPDSKWIAIGGSDEEGDGLFKFPVNGDPPTRIVTGRALNPIWSPKDDLILYGGAQVMAEVPILAVSPDGDPIEFPDIWVLRLDERIRFLPDGSGLVYMQGIRISQDFWFLDLKNLGSPDAMPAARRLTRLGGLAGVSMMRTFDIDPTGENIVFDRLDLNSDIVLFELEEPAD